MARLIATLKDNPFWGIAWSIFTMCVGFEVSHEYGFPEDANYFQHRTSDLGRMADELKRAEDVVAIWSEALSSSAERVNTLNQSLNPRTLAHGRIRETTSYLIRELAGIRNDLSKSLVTLRTTFFERSAFQDMRSKLLQDVLLVDRIAEKRVQFFETLRTNAREAADSLHSMIPNLEDERAALEGSTRRPYIDYVLDQARRDYNEYARESQTKLEMYNMRSTAAVAAFGYIGAFLGVGVGWLLYQRRRKLQLKAK